MATQNIEQNNVTGTLASQGDRFGLEWRLSTFHDSLFVFGLSFAFDLLIAFGLQFA